MQLELWRWISWVWIAVGICWLVAALRSKAVARRENPLSRIFHVAIMTAAFGLLFSSLAQTGVLGARFLPQADWTGWAGLCLTIAGCAFAVWARVVLGTNWSATVTIKQRHEFIRTGPYALVRHPIYSGFLLGVFGTALALGEVRGLMALGLAFGGWLMKARTEEHFLVDQFDGPYVRYCREVKQLIPFVF